MHLLAQASQKLGIQLNDEQLGMFQAYFKEMVEWNTRFNLTSIIEYDEVQVRHFLDSLTIVPQMREYGTTRGKNVIDIGSGAGLPGIPLKIILPELQVSLLEATTKKADFIKHMIELLDLQSTEVVNGRAEETAHMALQRGKYDFAVSRAVAALPALLELMLPFCKVGGYCIAPKKGNIHEELKNSEKALSVLGGVLLKADRVDTSLFDDERYLVVIKKVKPTPERYPRRPGMPVKRPL